MVSIRNSSTTQNKTKAALHCSCRPQRTRRIVDDEGGVWGTGKRPPLCPSLCTTSTRDGAHCKAFKSLCSFLFATANYELSWKRNEGGREEEVEKRRGRNRTEEEKEQKKEEEEVDEEEEEEEDERMRRNVGEED